MFFIIYEELFNQVYIKKLLNKIGINQNKNIDFNYFRNSNKAKISLDLDDILKNANDIYKSFLNLNG